MYKLSQEFVDLDVSHLPKLAKAHEENDEQELLNNRVSVDQPLPPVLPRILAAGVLSADDVNQRNQTAGRRLARNKLRTLRVRRVKSRRRNANQQQQMGKLIFAPRFGGDVAAAATGNAWRVYSG